MKKEMNLEIYKKAEIYLRFVYRYNPHYHEIFGLRGDDALQEAVMAILEHGDNFKEALRQIARRLYMIYDPKIKNIPLSISKSEIKHSKNVDTDMINQMSKILDFYESNDFSTTCEQFDLEPTNKLRKVFSDCAPKNEKANKKRGKREKVFLKDLSDEEISNLPHTTRWRAKERGWFYKLKD